MASAEFHFDPRIRRYHVPLKTQQHRLRHVRSIGARNVICPGDGSSEVELYYTLHCTPYSEAFYTSEVISDDLNPMWKEFEPCSFSESLNPASSFIIIKLWHKCINRLLIEWLVSFSGLHFLGKQIPKEGKHFKPNTLIFGMLEGYYGCSDCLQHSSTEIEEPVFKEAILVDMGNLRISYEMSTVGRIKTIERAIKQTQATASRRRKNIEVRLQEAQKTRHIKAERELCKIKVSMLQVEVQRQRSSFRSSQLDFSFTEDNLSKNQAELRNKQKELKKLNEKLAEMWQTVKEFRENLSKIETQLIFRRRELISDLCFIYPIVEFPDRKGFSIHNVHLPNSENLSGHDETMIAVALGYVCHLVLMISQFLNVPLRYEMRFVGSRSTIIDHISSLIPVKSREFPLYSKGKDKRFFEYAVYLLNKNIAQLRILFGLTTKELSATLPNLSSLIRLRLLPASGFHIPLHKTSLNLGCSEGSTKVPPEQHPQNGLARVSSTVHQENIQTRNCSSEIEHLKKEMAEMIPNPVVTSESNCVLSYTTSEVSGTLSGSLDKGLNDIKVLESSMTLNSNSNNQKPDKLVLQMKKIGRGYHHSSYPNLSANMQPLDARNLVLPTSSPQIPSVPLKMWIVGDSHTNSEEEEHESSSKLSAPSEVVLKDSRFFVPSLDWTTSGHSDTSFVKKDLNFMAIEKAMLEENDFGEDLALRTEQLASRSSSFQMQKLGVSNLDVEQLHS